MTRTFGGGAVGEADWNVRQAAQGMHAYLTPWPIRMVRMSLREDDPSRRFIRVHLLRDNAAGQGNVLLALPLLCRFASTLAGLRPGGASRLLAPPGLHSSTRDPSHLLPRQAGSAKWDAT